MLLEVCHGYVWLCFSSPEGVGVQIKWAKTILDGEATTWVLKGLHLTHHRYALRGDDVVFFDFCCHDRLCGIEVLFGDSVVYIGAVSNLIFTCKAVLAEIVESPLEVYIFHALFVVDYRSVLPVDGMRL